MPVEFASEYASIVGLLSAFSASRNSQKAEDAQSFIEWLIKHKHEELALEIQKNQSTSIFIKAFLNKEIPEIQLKLDSILALVQIVTERLQENPETSLEQDLGTVTRRESSHSYLSVLNTKNLKLKILATLLKLQMT